MTRLQPGPKPTLFNFAREVIDRWSQERAESSALVLVTQGKRRDVSYRELSERSIHVAAALYALGVRQGDTIVISAARCRDFYEILCAAIRSGILVCPVAGALSASDLEYRIQKVGAKAFIGDLPQIHKVLSIRSRLPTLRHLVQVGADEKVSEALGYPALVSMGQVNGADTTIDSEASSPCVLYFTSGSTGQPKLVQHSQISLALSSRIAGEHWCQLHPDCLFWSLSEVGWVKGSWAVFAAWNHGAALLVDETPGLVFDPIHTLQILHDYSVTNFCATPTAYRQLVTSVSREFAATHAPQSLKVSISAGEAIEGSVIEAWRQVTRGVPILNGYGLTETVFLCTESTDDQRPGSMGRPLPGVPLEILGETAEPVPIGEEGALGVCLSTCADSIYDVFNGYVDEQGVVTRPTVRNAEGKEYYLTGDRAFRDADGYFWFKARKDDIINCSGYRIGPSEVEAVLQMHPGVLESAVIGIPDEERGSIIKAYVVLNEEYEQHPLRKLKVELRQHCLYHSAPYKCPRVIEFLSKTELPRTVTGKVQRHELRAREQRKSSA
ncbi:acyl-coenzyme A synthetase ACSM3, mitochondrial [Aspergillus awamori]|uniref:medium-chain acyl-CoA ligase n=1 Tax=Aspergillus awamori TaxID=105351 RepID=A0A401KNE3_ASPAW|nr:acyl-coenzyme A synthetase ACSM3, mitochondrial [Aspergillus awamori]GKZ55612.1 putative NRPS-like protein biosynthetic cluster [Aspergillus niger]GLA08266.1 putative NRPS-like protein biosynthetic cluster [Aspergillus niger]GLA12609.1 putative NRPS-like protein biosynthetic cluster [Aspergillus niger]GLA33579.1 putative NRPS-like protein biosynthetic cluster [Aspergillus niger]